MSVCRRCGVALPPQERGRTRKWCSERCRKAQYRQPCIDCGTLTIHGSERPRQPEPRCWPCMHASGLRSDHQRAHERAQRIVEWWAEGLTGSEIARRLGWDCGYLGGYIDQLRKRGYDLPYRYQRRKEAA